LSLESLIIDSFKLVLVSCGFLSPSFTDPLRSPSNESSVGFSKLVFLFLHKRINLTMTTIPMLMATIRIIKVTRTPVDITLAAGDGGVIGGISGIVNSKMFPML